MNYPTGVRMRNYRRRPLRGRFRRHRNKYHAHHFFADGHWWDSKAEYSYYELLKRQKKIVKCHQRFRIVPHTKYNQVHYYTPDFCIYDNNGNLIEADDIKGITYTNVARTYDNLRMDLWQRLHHMPITIVRLKNGHFIKKRRKVFKN